MSRPLIQRSSLRWVLAYIAAATLWIGLMQWLLASFGGERWTISAAGLVVGGLFVLMTAWLLFLVLERSQSAIAEAWHHSFGLTYSVRVWWMALIAFVGLTLLLQVFMVLFATREYRPFLIEQAHHALTAQAREQRVLIDAWFEQRNQFLANLAAKPAVLVDKITANQPPTPKSQADLAALITNPLFAQTSLFDSDHHMVEQFGSKNAQKAPDALFEQAAATSNVQTSCQFDAGRMGGACYWVLPIFLNQKEVSGGPWYVVFYSALSSQTLSSQTVASARASSELPAKSNQAQTLMLLTPDDDHAGVWRTTSLAPTQANSGAAAPSLGTQVLAPDELTCYRQSTVLAPLLAQGLSSVPHAKMHAPSAIAQGQLSCDGQTQWFAAFSLSQIPAVFLVKIAQDDALLPLRQTRQWLALAALVGVFALIFALFFVWKIMRINNKKSLHQLQIKHDQLAQLWEQIPTVGLAIATRENASAAWLISTINRRCLQLFHAPREQLVGRALAALLQPAIGQADPLAMLISDQQSLDDLIGGIRDEIVFVRQLALDDGALVWRQFNIRVLQTSATQQDSLIIAIENLADSMAKADALQTQRDFYCLASQWLQAKKPVDPAPLESNAALMAETTVGAAITRALGSADAAPEVPASESVAPLAESPLAQLAAELMAQTPIVALCRYTHWAEVWSTSSDLSGPLLEQQEHKAYDCFGGTAPVRDIANQIAAMGVIDRVLVAQTPLFVDDAVKNTSLSAAASVQTELIEQLRPYPVGALAIVPIQGSPDVGYVQAWVVIGNEKLRFDEPVKAALLSALSALSERVRE